MSHLVPPKTRRVLRSGDLIACEHHLSQAAVEPSLKQALLADIQRQAGDLKQASKTLSRLRRLHSPGAQLLVARVKGELLAATGQVAEALDALEHVILEGRSLGEHEQVALAALSRFTALATHRSLAESQQGLEVAKRAVLTCGDAQLMAALHARVGQAHAQRHLPAIAVIELESSLRLLEPEPNGAIQAFAYLALSGAQYLLARHQYAAQAARAAKKVADSNGLRGLAAAAQANLAFLECRRGNFERARELAMESASLLPRNSLARGASAETLANVALALDDSASAREAVATIESIIAASSGSTLLQVDSAASRAELLRREGDLPRAVDLLEAARLTAEERGDLTAWAKLTLRRAEFLVLSEKAADAKESLVEVLERVRQGDPELLALTSRARALIAGADGDTVRSRLEFGRSKRLFKASGDRFRFEETLRLEREGVLESGSPTRVKRRHRALLELSECLSFVSGLLPHPSLAGAETVRLLRRFGLADDARVVHGVAPEQIGRHDIDLTGSGPSRWMVRVLPKPDTVSRQTLAHVHRVVDLAVIAVRAETEAARRVLSWELDTASDAKAGLYISEPMKRLLATVRKVASSRAPVLLTGETGTGKEVVANELHAASPRAQKPFIPINVTAVPRDMLEGLLFGYRRGAFTGAVSDHKGLIREAEGGTLFIDEIGELSPELQPKLLRFLESGEIQPLGERPQRVDVRVVAATNASLEHLVREGRFREDLFYRLNVIQLAIPPLRDRREEIPTLVHHFLTRHAQDAGKPIPQLSPRALECLSGYHWPGNVRQLTNEIKRLVALADEDETVDVHHLAHEIRLAPPPPIGPAGDHVACIRLDQPLQQMYEDVDRAAIPWALRVSRNNQRIAAARLGLTRKGLYVKRARVGLLAESARTETSRAG